jgi:hypothetical protein
MGSGGVCAGAEVCTYLPSKRGNLGGQLWRNSLELAAINYNGDIDLVFL